MKNAASRSGAETVSFTANGVAFEVDSTHQLVEFTGGLDTIDPVDAATITGNTASGTSATGAAGSVTTGFANEVEMAVFSMDDNNGFTTPTGYTKIDEAKDNAGQIKTVTQIAFQSTTATGTFAPT